MLEGVALTEKKAIFVAEYRRLGVGSEAVLSAGITKNRKSAASIAYKLLRDVDVINAMNVSESAAVQELALQSRDVLERYIAGAFLDRNEIVQLRRTCCRWCHGLGHRYQFTAPEMEMRREAFDAHVIQVKEANREREIVDRLETPVWDEKGGIGFNPKCDAHPECPACFGEGIEDVYLEDTRKLGPQARMIYGGAKRTKHGIEVNMLDKQANLDKLAQSLGILKGSEVSVEVAPKVYVNCNVADIGSMIFGKQPAALAAPENE